MTAPTFEDGAWYWVEKEGWHDEPPKIAPAMYRADCDAWYSWEFSGISTEYLKVLEPCVRHEQAARRAPVVPQGLREAAQAVVERWDTPLWKDVPATAVYIADLRAALAAAPQPPESAQLDDIDVADMAQAVDSKEAAHVQLPEYDIDTANHAGIRVRGYTQETVRQLLADQQFKLDELAMLTRMVVHAFRQVAPDNKTAAKAVDYLKRKGLAGNPLRAAQEQST